MIPLVALLMLQAQPASPGTTSSADPVADWLISESDLSPRAAQGHRDAYARYRAAGGVASYRDWRRALIRGDGRFLYPCPAGGACPPTAKRPAVPANPAPAIPNARRACLDGRQVRVSERYNTWFRIASAIDRRRLARCHVGSRNQR